MANTLARAGTMTGAQGNSSNVIV